MRIERAGAVIAGGASCVGAATTRRLYAGGARIVIADVDGQVAHVAYAASKAAVVGLTLPAKRELANAGFAS